MANEKRNQQPDRRANRTILGRTLFLMVFFGVVAFVPLLVTLYNLQITRHEELEARALDQQTRDITVSASRGSIYDSNGRTLAMSATVYNVQLSPLEVIQVQEDYAKRVENAKGDPEKLPKTPEPTNEFIASNLARLLGVDEADILKRLEKTWSQYEILKSRIEWDEAKEVREFLTENGLTSCVYLPPTTKRYYHEGSLAAHVIGWVNWRNDNKGAYGMEAVYESELAGETGRVVTAKNGRGTEMLYRYEEYYDAQDGNNLNLTIDTTIQYYCEQVLAKGVEKFEVQNGGFAIAMNPKTGAILAWANSPTYDLNAPWTIIDPVLLEYLETVKNDPSASEDAYLEALGQAQNQQWRNKALNDTYEPGSTFKSLVLAAALEEGVVSESDYFYCSGSKVVIEGEDPIRCSQRSGHKDQDLAEAVANSCNPAFIEIGQRLGAERFWSYLEDFGLMELTGVDMQGERNSNFWTKDYFVGPYGVMSLATASFGQRFTITPIQMITAASAVVNGGHLMKPYVVQSITDQDGNILSYTEPTEVRQVISEESSAQCRTILEGVVDGGTGKNARVQGYRIGGKTGSSETQQDDHTVVSFLGFAPADDPQVVILLAYDNPKPTGPNSNYTSGGWYISGGSMAASMAGELLGNILDHLGVEKTYTAEADTLVPNVVTLSLADATTRLNAQNLTVRTVGDGDTVSGQIPASGASIPGGSEVVLYMGSEAPADQVEVPDVSGMNMEAARQAMSQVGLYLKATGAAEYGSGTIASSQSLDPGTLVSRGTVIEVHFTDNTGGAGL